MDRKWVLIRSWHVIKGYSRAAYAMTYCGRTVAVEGSITAPLDMLGEPFEIHATADTLALGDRSCETCLRISAKAEDQ